MMHRDMGLTIFALLVCTQTALVLSYGDSSDLVMKCFYGERGSLTATCVNANASYFKLTQYRFDQLDETLRCQNCSLQSLDTGTFDLSGNLIRNLIISNSHIEVVKQRAFVGLIFLENLDMSHNKIRSIYPGTFSGVKKIKNIDLSYNELNILSDDGFLELIQLEKLNLYNNVIKTISGKAFNGLGMLSVLNMTSNSISDLRNIFTNLSTLQILSLDHNEITTLEGNEFSNLTSLLSLNLAYNRLESPVIELGNNSLKSLDLSHNEIKSLSGKFLSGLHYLETLDMSFNKIEKINTKVLINLHKLHSLDLSYNNLVVFETATFTGLPRLELLNCSHNRIFKVSVNGVMYIRSVHSLDLSYNAMQELDYISLISRLPSLSYLRLEGNNLPCYLDSQMETYFMDDNFKYVLYNDSSKKCVDTPMKESLKALDEVVADSGDHPGVTGAEITIIVMICVIFVCIGFLFFLQYRSYQDTRLTIPNRAISSVHLMSSEGNENEYLRE